MTKATKSSALKSGRLGENGTKKSLLVIKMNIGISDCNGNRFENLTPDEALSDEHAFKKASEFTANDFEHLHV